MSYRYVIFGKDVIGVGPAKKGKTNATRIDYHIGDAVLSLVVVDQSILDEFRRQILFQQPSVRRIERTLAPICTTS